MTDVHTRDELDAVRGTYLGSAGGWRDLYGLSGAVLLAALLSTELLLSSSTAEVTGTSQACLAGSAVVPDADNGFGISVMGGRA